MNQTNMKKKAYSKPMVSFVDFSLSGSIASTCRNSLNSTDVNSCGYEEDGWIHFSTLVCEIVHEEGEYCYQVPEGDVSVFAS